MIVLHKCDNRKCVNPAHLMSGTYRDNHDDCVAKNRYSGCAPQGEANPNSKLTPQKVLDLRSAYAAGHATVIELGRQYGISRQSAYDIINRRTWAHV